MPSNVLMYFIFVGCDLVAFHTEDYCLNFLDCCQRILGCQLEKQKMLVQHHGRVIQVKALPIGIPYGRFETLAKSAPSVYGENSKVSTLDKIGMGYTYSIHHCTMS